MASYSSVFAYLLLCFFLSLSVSNAQPSSSSRPGGLFFPVTIDTTTLQYATKITLGKVPVNLVIDLGRKSSWIYSSGGCASKSISGVVTAQSNNLKDGEWVSGPNVTARGISFVCETNSSLLRGLPKGAKGIAGLGRSSNLSLTSQFSAAFRFPQKFALELPSSLYFGDGPYTNQNFRQPLAYTPLLTNSYFPTDYFVDVRSIEIDGSNVTLNKGLLAINKKNGAGGTKFSSLVPSVPYTAMETSIYKAFTSVYIKTAKARGISMVAPVAPFSACFNASTIESRPDGLVVPTIALGMANNVDWIMTGPGNSLEFVEKNVYCLAFVDGGSKPKASIVIGNHQMQYNIIEFDVPRSRLGFSPPVQV